MICSKDSYQEFKKTLITPVSRFVIENQNKILISTIVTPKTQSSIVRVIVSLDHRNELSMWKINRVLFNR